MHLTARWSSSMTLFRYLFCRILIGVDRSALRASSATQPQNHVLRVVQSLENFADTRRQRCARWFFIFILSIPFVMHGRMRILAQRVARQNLNYSIRAKLLGRSSRVDHGATDCKPGKRLHSGPDCFRTGFRQKARSARAKRILVAYVTLPKE